MEKYSRNEQIIDGELDDNQVMMHLDKGKFFGLNPVAKRIWQLIENPKTIEEIIALLLEEYDVQETQCLQEVNEFLDKAIQCDIVIINEGA